MMGKSSCSSVASSAAKRSKHSLTTSEGRASCLSTLLTQTIGSRPIFKALPTTNLVCHRPFGGVDEHDRAVDHRKNALDLAAEIGVARRVDDIDAHALPHHRGRLGQDGDAALALEVVGIHHPLGDALVFAERAGLLQQAVDQRRLAVVDVGDDGDVSQLHGGPGFWRGANRKKAAGGRAFPRWPI